MDVLREVFLESPVIVYLTAGLAELVTVGIWRQTRAPRARVMLAVWPALALAAGLVAHAVVTDREKVRATWDEIAAAIEASDVDRLMGNVADDFASKGLDRAALEALAKEAALHLAPRTLTIGQVAVDAVTPEAATVTLTASYARSAQRTRWSLTFAPQADGAWRLTGVECTEPADLDLRQAVNLLKQARSLLGV